MVKPQCWGKHIENETKSLFSFGIVTSNSDFCVYALPKLFHSFFLSVSWFLTNSLFSLCLCSWIIQTFSLFVLSVILYLTVSLPLASCSVCVFVFNTITLLALFVLFYLTHFLSLYICLSTFNHSISLFLFGFSFCVCI